MARIIKTIEIEGQPATVLFDTGATYTYVRSSLVANAVRRLLTRPVRGNLGGQNIEVRQLCLIQGKIEGLDFFTVAVPLAQLGRAAGDKLDVIIGTLTMKQWDLRPDPKSRELDLEGLKRRTFTEFGFHWERHDI
jgi:hypothetical protein